MLKPPFTIIILKRPHQPLTIRFTYGTALMLFLPFLIAGAVGGYFISGRMAEDSVKSNQITSAPATSSFVATDKPENPTDTQNGIRSLTISRKSGNSLAFDVDFTETATYERVYVWLIVNSSSGDGSIVEVIPRNPLFRGLPVDFRNGMLLYPRENNSMTVSLSDDIDTLEIDGFRVLIYSPAGDILADRYYQNGTV